MLLAATTCYPCSVLDGVNADTQSGGLVFRSRGRFCQLNGWMAELLGFLPLAVVLVLFYIPIPRSPNRFSVLCPSRPQLSPISTTIEAAPGSWMNYAGSCRGSPAFRSTPAPSPLAFPRSMRICRKAVLFTARCTRSRPNPTKTCPPPSVSPPPSLAACRPGLSCLFFRHEHSPVAAGRMDTALPVSASTRRA